jgi:hypothetical protein
MPTHSRRQLLPNAVMAASRVAAAVRRRAILVRPLASIGYPNAGDFDRPAAGNLRFNARGPDGLLDGKSTGQPSKLNDTQRQATFQSAGAIGVNW